MPGTIHRAKKLALTKVGLPAKKIAKHNLKVLQYREKWIKDFGLELRPKTQPLDPEVRSVSIKFTRLPFGVITDSCGGHFSKTFVASSLNEIPVAKLEPGKKIYFGGANFEMMLDYSPEAVEFRKALKTITEKRSFVKFKERGGIISFGILDVYTPKTREEIQEVRTANLQFVKEFEKVVNRFVKRYGIGRDKLKSR